MTKEKLLQDIDPITLKIHPDLENAGDIMERSGKLDVDGYWVNDKHFITPDGLIYDLVFTHTGEGVLVTGLIKGKSITECDRCLQEANLDIAAEVQGYYLFQVPDTDLEDLEGDEFELVAPNDTVDISNVLKTAIIFDTDFTILCKDDCKGLCPQCGKNLNEGPCDCKEEDEIDDMNPFAVLKNLDLSSNNSEDSDS